MFLSRSLVILWLSQSWHRRQVARPLSGHEFVPLRAPDPMHVRV